MSDAKAKELRRSLLEIAIEGDGLSPADVSVRQLSDLLQATASVLEAIAEEQGLPAPTLRLVAVKEGSAAYDLMSPDGDSSSLFNEFRKTAKERAQNSSPKIRQSFIRLHSTTAARLGSLRIAVCDASGKQRGKPVHLAPPIEPKAALEAIENLTEIYARVVGVAIRRGDRAMVSLRGDDGPTEDFEADFDIAQTAAQYFNKTVVASVSYVMGADRNQAGRLENVVAWEAVDTLDAIRSAREELQKDGVEINVAEWLAELDETSRD